MDEMRITLAAKLPMLGNETSKEAKLPRLKFPWHTALGCRASMHDVVESARVRIGFKARK
jgi:hypothetical protein